MTSAANAPLSRGVLRYGTPAPGPGVHDAQDTSAATRSGREPQAATNARVMPATSRRFDFEVAAIVERSRHHAPLRNLSGLRDTTPCIPEAADANLALPRVPRDRISGTLRGLAAPSFSPRLPRARSTASRKIVICRYEQGERRDSNPRPPGPQPAPTGTSKAYSALSGDPSCSQLP